MKYLLPLFIAGLILLSSCASLFNSRNMKLQVSSAHPCYLVNNPAYKEINTGNGYRSYFTGDQIPLKPHKPIYLVVARDKESLRMEFVKDSFRTMVDVRSRLSWVYYLNFIYIYGFLIDIPTPKKWEYDNDIFVDVQHPQHTFVRHSSLKAPPTDPEVSTVTYTKGTSSASDPDLPKVTFMKDSLKRARKHK